MTCAVAARTRCASRPPGVPVEAADASDVFHASVYSDGENGYTDYPLLQD